MLYNKILPEKLRNELQAVTETISDLNVELYDEATHFIIDALKEKAESKKKHFLFGLKYIADVDSKLQVYEQESMYKVVKNN